jgi:hypothetical protein
MSPTARTIAYFKSNGAVCRIVEKWIPITPAGYRGKMVRRDLWGADLQVAQGSKLLGVQCCAGTDHSKRVNKSCADPDVHHWLNTGNGFEVWSWAKRGDRGKRKLWKARVTQLVLDKKGKVVLL